MLQTVLKFAITAAIVVAASAASRRSTLLGALLVSLPLTSILAISWLQYETRDVEQVAALTTSILWLVLPSLVFFVVLPALLRRDISFGVSLAAASAATIAAYYATLKVLTHLGVQL